MNTLKKLLTVGVTVAALASAPTAFALVVAPGATGMLPGTTAAAEPSLAGVVLEDELIRFSLPVSQTSQDLITGTVQQRVVRQNSSGTLDFYWRITELSGGSLGFLRVANFITNTYDANYRIDGLGDIGPASLTHFTNGLGGATNDFSANFNFANDANADTLAAGQSSLFMFLHTNATTYAKTAFVDIASTGTYTASQQFAAFAPAVPEPETFVMLLAGLGVVGLVTRRRRVRLAGG